MSRRALVPTWIFLIILVNLSQGAKQRNKSGDNAPSHHKSKVTVPPNLDEFPPTTSSKDSRASHNVDEHPPPPHPSINTISQLGNQTTKQPTIHSTYPPSHHHASNLPSIHATNPPTNSSANHTEPTPPGFVVESSPGEPCILATFNMTIRISYYVKSKKGDTKYIAFRDVNVPDDDDVINSGVCGENQSSLILEWDNSTFHLNLTFVKHMKGMDKEYLNWTLDAIEFGYNLSNYRVFPGAIDDDFVSVSKSNLKLYNTVIGHSQECESDVRVGMGKDAKGAEIKLRFVKFAAFNLTSADFPETIDQCLVKGKSIRDEDIMVPLIIACSLSLVIIIVVVAYAISRKVHETRDQTQYKPMP